MQKGTFNRREAARQQRLARSRFSDQDNVGLLNLHIVSFRRVGEALVVVVDRHAQRTLRIFLTDDVFIEEALDVGGPFQLQAGIESTIAI